MEAVFKFQIGMSRSTEITLRTFKIEVILEFNHINVYNIILSISVAGRH